MPTRQIYSNFGTNSKNSHCDGKGRQADYVLWTDNVSVCCGRYGADAVDIAVEMVKGSSASCYFLCVRVHAHS